MEVTPRQELVRDADIRMAAYQLRDRWEVTAIWRLGHEYVFVVDFTDSGIVLASTLRRGTE
jgi:hypothetical protein